MKSESDIKRNWELIKLKENNKKKSILDGVPKTLPSILKSWRIQEKVGGAGFEWKNVSKSLNKIDEEFNELKFEIENNNVENIEEEFGDVLFSLINYSRYLNIILVDALEKTNQKFIERFKKMENEIYSDNKKIEDLKVSELEKYWKRIKKL